MDLKQMIYDLINEFGPVSDVDVFLKVNEEMNVTEFRFFIKELTEGGRIRYNSDDKLEIIK